MRCAGVRGEVALDDAYVAGRLVDRIAELTGGADLTDGARTARAIARAYADPLAALRDSQSARDLDGTGPRARRRALRRRERARRRAARSSRSRPGAS